ncbi:nucleoside ABC transporter ATP-binding protein [Pseudonocardia thermophila]|uniref:Nucleoside ABC transporter ATP-binding protein n=1 Tax=Pseudonocardia thermophila TaxID=1848 RepID=A0A1M6P681_PSETH|nr:ABC transporter ATP-binding protein [Pseudonocardia thermophila]SHK03487.1 nucleoside ABC transporter ATP-binding protein [Pseudonocardia thermophila]
MAVPTARPTDSAASAALSVRGVSKAYGDLLANDGIDLEVRPGEILALLGENGAGKSTLVKILSGLVRPDAGEVLVDGRPLPPGDPLAARAAGIGVVHQHFMLVPDMTATENVALAQGRAAGRRFDAAATRARLMELSERHGMPVRPDVPVEQLPVGERQRIEILKCLLGDARVLLLDEPSAVLSPVEWDRLAVVLKELAAAGLAIVLITHKLGEIAAVADRCTVMRSGRVVATVQVGETRPEELARLMVGRDVVLRSERPRIDPGPVILEVSGLTLASYRGDRDLGPIDLVVRGGEVLGVAGVEGNGQSELADLLAGVRTPTAGTVRVTSRTAGPGRVGVIAEDRHTDGLALSLSVIDNLMMRVIGQEEFSRHGVLRPGRIRRRCAELVERFDVRTPGLDTPVERLSGGNQQKIVLARELSGEPDLLIAAQPTRGLDVGAIEFVHGRINAHKTGGGATVLISAELDEVLALSDRIAVMSAGRIVAVLDAAEATRDRIGELMAAGVEQGEDVVA